MTPAEFYAARDARRPWIDERIRHELTQAIAHAQSIHEMGVHVRVPLHSLDRFKVVAVYGGWTTATHDRRDGSARVDLSPGGPQERIDLACYRTSSSGPPTADEHRAHVEARRPLQQQQVVRLVDEAIHEAVEAEGDDRAPALTVRRHSLQTVVDRASALGWSCYLLTPVGTYVSEDWLHSNVSLVTDQIRVVLCGHPLAQLEPLRATSREQSDASMWKYVKSRNDDSNEGHESITSIFCDHANECPAQCTCGPGCYCKSHTCRSVNR